MIINKYRIQEDNWTGTWIPFSYAKILSKRQYNKSISLVWNTDDTINAICRVYYISKDSGELGDIWLNPSYRGKLYANNCKLSFAFMIGVINLIWNNYQWVKTITLLVSETNLPALRLYQQLQFNILKKYY